MSKLRFASPRLAPKRAPVRKGRRRAEPRPEPVAVVGLETIPLPVTTEGLGDYMTEAEFDRRLQNLLKSNMTAEAMGDLDGFADLFSSLKNVFVSAGSAIASGAGKLASGLASSASGIVSNIGSALTSPGGQSLISTAGQFLVTKQAAKIEQNKIALQTALVNQGYVPTSPAAQGFLTDVAQNGVVAANGRVLIPGAGGTLRGSRNGGGGIMGSVMANPMPWVLGGAGLIAVLLLTRSSGGGHHA